MKNIIFLHFKRFFFYFPFSAIFFLCVYFWNSSGDLSFWVRKQIFKNNNKGVTNDNLWKFGIDRTNTRPPVNSWIFLKKSDFLVFSKKISKKPLDQKKKNSAFWTPGVLRKLAHHAAYQNYEKQPKSL